MFELVEAADVPRQGQQLLLLLNGVGHPFVTHQANPAIDMRRRGNRCDQEIVNVRVAGAEAPPVGVVDGHRAALGPAFLDHRLENPGERVALLDPRFALDP